MADNSDVQVQLHDLEAEEARIMRELREIDEKARAESAAAAATASALPQGDAHIDDPDAALASLLAECEKEVRDAKGYISDHGPPLRIVRLRKGEQGPKTATYLSRPRNTGVDFTIPVAHKSYSQAVKTPIFLNDIRDKIRSRAYTHPDEYIADMRLLYRNTDTFNKGPDLEWVVQHARLLLEAAEEAVKSRSKSFAVVESAMRQSSSTKQRPPAPASKRKRTSDPSHSDRPPIPPVGTIIEIWWGPPYRRWFSAVILDRSGPTKAYVRYKSDESSSWVTLHGSAACNWRIPVPKPPTPTAAPRPSSRRADPPPGKKRRAAPSSPRSSAGAPVVIDTVNGDNDVARSTAAPQTGDAISTVKEQIREGLERVEFMVHRSDGLQRVLLAVQDTQDTLQSSLGKLSKSVEQIKSSVRSVQRDVAELKEAIALGMRGSKIPRPDSIDYKKDANELSRRHDLKKGREGHTDTRKERAGGRDYDRDFRGTDPRRGNMDYRNKASTRPEGKRIKGDRAEPFEKKSDTKFIERTVRDEDPMEIDNEALGRRDRPKHADFVTRDEGHKDKANSRNSRGEDERNDYSGKDGKSRSELERGCKVGGEGKGNEDGKDLEKKVDRVVEVDLSPKVRTSYDNDDQSEVVEIKDNSGSIEKRKGQGIQMPEKSFTDDEQEDDRKLKGSHESNDRMEKSARREDKDEHSNSDSASNSSSDSDDNEDRRENRHGSDNENRKEKDRRNEDGENDGSTSKKPSPKQSVDLSDDVNKRAKKVDKDDIDDGPVSDGDGDRGLPRRREPDRDSKRDHGSDRESSRDGDGERDRTHRRDTERVRNHNHGSDRESSRGGDHESDRESDHSRKREIVGSQKRGSDSEDELYQNRDPLCGREKEGGRKSDRKGDGWNGGQRNGEGGQRDDCKDTLGDGDESDRSEDLHKSREKGSDGKGTPKGSEKDTDGREDRDDSSDGSDDHDVSSSESEEDDRKESSKADRDFGREVKRGSGAGSRPKVSRFAQAPEEDEANTGLNRDQGNTKKAAATKETSNGVDGSKPGTPVNEDDEGKTTNGNDAKTNGAGN